MVEFFCVSLDLFIYLLYNIVLVLSYIDLNPPWVYMCSPSQIPLPPHPIPLGYPSAPAPNTLYHASNLDWQFVSHMIIYLFQCHSPKSSHPLPLPQSPKDCSIPLCVSIPYWCFSFWLTSLCIIGSSFIHLIRTDSNVFFLMAE